MSLRVFDVQRFSIHDGPGIRTTVFLQGCPLRCAWCQNPEAFGVPPAPALGVDAVMAEVRKDRAYYAASGGGLTVSGGEPLLHPASAHALLTAARAEGIHTCVQTCGSVPQANLEAVLGSVDLFQFDVKHLDAERHRRLTGAGTERIHASAAFLHARGAAIEFRMPVVPGVNDDDGNLAALARFLDAHGVGTITLLGYHRLYEQKYAALGLPLRLPGVPAATEHDLARVAAGLARLGVATAAQTCTASRFH